MTFVDQDNVILFYLVTAQHGVQPVIVY